MKKHAYLIMAHHHFEQLKFLISLLDHPRNDIFLFIDKRANVSQDVLEDLKATTIFSKVVLSQRLPNYWGGMSRYVRK